MRYPSISPRRIANLLGSLSACALAVLVGCSSQVPPEDSGSKDSGPQDDARFVGGCRVGLPLPSAPCYACDPLPADSHSIGCTGPLPSLWGWDGGTAGSATTYPLNCTAYLPVENPYYPGGPQSCGCLQINDTSLPQWTCGL